MLDAFQSPAAESWHFVTALQFVTAYPAGAVAL